MPKSRGAAAIKREKHLLESPGLFCQGRNHFGRIHHVSCTVLQQPRRCLELDGFDSSRFQPDAEHAPRLSHEISFDVLSPLATLAQTFQSLHLRVHKPIGTNTCRLFLDLTTACCLHAQLSMHAPIALAQRAPHAPAAGLGPCTTCSAY